MSLVNKKYVSVENYSSLKRVYLKVFNIEIYSVITSSLYSIVFRILYLSIMFYFLILVDLNNFSSILALVTGYNSFNLVYILQLILIYFFIYSLIILLLCKFFFWNNEALLNNFLKFLDQLSLFLYNNLFYKLFFFFNILGKSPSDFEKHLNYGNKK